MPTYDYQCTECGHQFEIMQSMKDDALTVCPECKGKLKRLIGAGAGLIFKGTGFYITDYKNNGKPSSSSKSESGSSSGETTKTESPKTESSKTTSSGTSESSSSSSAS